MGSSSSKVSAPVDAPRLCKRIHVAQGEWGAYLRRDAKLLFDGRPSRGKVERLLSHPDEDAAPAAAPEPSRSTSYAGAEHETKADEAGRITPLAGGQTRGELLLAKYSLVTEGLDRVERLLANVSRRLAYRDALLEMADEAERASPARADSLRRVAAFVLEEAKRDMGRHDQAVWAVDWMRKDYKLSAELARLSSELDELREAERGAAPDAGDEPTKQVRRLEKAKGKAEKKLVQHQLASLVVGLQLLDSNHSGYVEPADLPECSVELFSELDVSSNHRITASDMEKFVKDAGKRRDEAAAARDKAADAYDEARAALAEDDRSDRVARERLEVALGHRADELRDASTKLKGEQGKIDQVYHIFGTVFSREVLDKLDLPIADVRTKMTRLRESISAEDKAAEQRATPEEKAAFHE